MRHDAPGSELADLPAHHADWPTCRFRFEPEPCAVREQRREASGCCSHREPTSSPDKRQDRTARYHQPSFNGVHRRSGLLPSSRRRCRATRFHGRNRSLSRRGGTSFDRCRWCRSGNGLAGSRLSRSASQVGRAQLLSAFLRSGAPVYRARFRRLFNDGRRLADRLLIGGDRFRFHGRFISAGRRFRAVPAAPRVGPAQLIRLRFRSPSHCFAPARLLERPQVRCRGFRLAHDVGDGTRGAVKLPCNGGQCRACTMPLKNVRPC